MPILRMSAVGRIPSGRATTPMCRLSSLVANTSTSALLFQSQRGYDAIGNVTAVNTTLAAGTDNQAFCYDEQNRLVWAGASGTPSCGASLTAGSLTSASYTQTFAYDTLDRLTSGPLGSYTYGDSAHLHAVTSIGSGPTYTASYDAVGDMTCRAPDNTATCSGTPTGAVLGYDNEGRLTAWQNAPSSPTTTDGFLYDGAGNRVEQLVTVNGSITTTTTYVAGGIEAVASNGVGTTLTKYFAAGGLPTAERVGTNGPLSYLATDGQGSLSEAFDGAGNVTSAQLYDPHGNTRYSSGSSPTSFGYTGQRADSSTGLDYYNARYYDPVAGQFTSADTVDDGFNRYGYVAGNPTTYTDPTGHMLACKEEGDCGPLKSPAPQPPKHTCVTDNNCPTTPQPQPPSNGSGTGGGGKGGSNPLVYDSVLAECGPLAVICASVINALGGANIFANKDAELNIGIILAVIGVVIDVADIIYTVTQTADKGKAIAIALGVLGGISTILGYLSNLHVPDWIKSTMFTIATVVDTLAGGFEAAAALYLDLGPWGEFAADAAVTTVTTAAEGETAPVIGILGMLGGDAVTYYLGTVGSAFTSIGESLIADSYA